MSACEIRGEDSGILREIGDTWELDADEFGLVWKPLEHYLYFEFTGRLELVGNLGLRMWVGL